MAGGGSSSNNEAKRPANDEPDYLTDSFDPKILKVPQLKSILGRHGVTTPTSAQKKEVYVDLFKSNITPIRERLRQEAMKDHGKPPKNFASGETLVFDSGHGSSSNPTTPATTRKGRRVTMQHTPAALHRPEDDAESPFSEDNIFQTSPSEDAKARMSTKKKTLVKRRKSEGAPAAAASSKSALASLSDYVDVASESDEAADQLPVNPVKQPAKRSSRVAAAVASIEQSSVIVDLTGSAPARRGSTRRKTLPANLPAPITPVRKTAAGKRKSLATTTLRQDSDDSGDKSDGAEEAVIVKPVKRKGKAPAASGESSASTTGAAQQQQLPGTPVRFMNLPAGTPANATYSDAQLTSIPPPFGSDSATESPGGASGDNWSTVTPKTPTPPSSLTPVDPARTPSRHQFRGPTATLPRGRSDGWNVLIALAMLAVLALGHWYWEQKEVLEFCDPNDPAKHAAPFPGYNPLRFVLPTCKQCPENGICVGQTILSCEQADYILKPSKLATLVPSGHHSPSSSPLPFFLSHPTCVKDVRKQKEALKEQQHIETLLELLDTTVRTWIGTAECGGFKEDIVKPARSNRTGQVLGMPLGLAKDELRRLVGKKWPAGKFDYFFDRAIDEIRGNPSHASTINQDTITPPLRIAPPEISERISDSRDQTRLLHPHKPPIMPLTCRLSRSILETCRAYWMQLSGLGITLVFFAWFSLKRQTIAREARISARLIQDVLGAVADQADNHALDPTHYPIPGISVTQLKDHFLPAHAPPLPPSSNQDTTTAVNAEGGILDEETGRMQFYVRDDAARDRIWDDVARRVNRDSSLRETVMDLGGQSHMVWQWIGSHALSPRPATRKQASLLHQQSSSSSIPALDFGAAKEHLKAAAAAASSLSPSQPPSAAMKKSAANPDAGGKEPKRGLADKVAATTHHAVDTLVDAVVPELDSVYPKAS
ncbi:hypothetical protein PhCBS80983_g04884 [Powellomyces hirtus]|uniref:LEM-like domain-containing protein n=1 Tax=Powellomyces hirtus TaxID=109895 RepID=A0A507DW29_9FUNG|nr:hypothetical protein PhCBS80983_g04884 [Powellomyces hirtus]